MTGPQGLQADPLLAARLRVEALLADICHCIDEDRLEQWPEFFTPDGIYRVTTRENRELGLPVSMIYCAGRGMMGDRISAMRTANIFEPHVYCHVTSALRLSVQADDSLKASCNFVVMRTMASGEMSVFACGRYEDEIVEADRRLMLRSRTVVLDSRSIDTLLVVPL